MTADIEFQEFWRPVPAQNLLPLRKMSCGGSILILRGDGVLNPAMNNTKWNELRLGMDALTPTPAWSTVSSNGYRSPPDREWVNHFRTGGYDDIICVDIRVENRDHRESVRAILKKIHVPGEETPEGFRVWGYFKNGQAVSYI